MLERQANRELKRTALSAGALRVLEGLARGRQQAIQRAKTIGAENALLVLHLANLDAAAGRPLRGRAGRISRALAGRLSERSVLRIISDRLSVCPIQTR